MKKNDVMIDLKVCRTISFFLFFYMVPTLVSIAGVCVIKSLSLNERPVITISDQSDGKKLSVSGYDSYQWILDGKQIHGATHHTYLARESGAYQVRAILLETTYISEVIDLDVHIVNQMPVNPNYIRTKNIIQKGVKSESAIKNSNSKTSYRYIDRLGRPIQSVSQQASPQNFDVLQHHEYNLYGQSTLSYLSHTSRTTDGRFDPNVKAAQAAFYQTAMKVPHDRAPWSEVKIERSPQQRIMKSGGVGESYQLDQGFATEQIHSFNTESDQVFEWIINENGDLRLKGNKYHPANSLLRLESRRPEYTSGNNYKTITFTNFLGQKILARSYNDNQQFDTYYVYDSQGEVVCIVSPKASSISRNSGIPVIAEDHIFDSSANFTTGYSNDEDYYYVPGSKITLSPSLRLKAGFSITKLPEGTTVTDNEPEAGFSKMIFINKYDQFGRLVSKQAPGIEPVYYVYDKAGKLRLSQDGEQRKKSQWTFTKYDQLNRPVLTGLVIDQRSHEDLMTYFNAHIDPKLAESRGSAVHGYTNSTWPSTPSEQDYLVVSYYDDYEFMGTEWTSLAHVPNNNINNDLYRSYPRGLETGGKVRILSSDNWLKSVKYYDDDLQLIQGISDHHKGGLEKVYTQYNWLGVVLKTRFEHEISDSKTLTVEERLAYDSDGRLKEQYHSIDSEPEILVASYQYNELGELIEKNLHKQPDNTFVQSVDYRYNIRGQLTNINKSERNTLSGDTDDHPDRFGMELYYDSSPNGLSFDTQTKGNLAGTTWGHAAMAESDERSYGYSYDKVNRLTGATYRAKKGDSWNASKNHHNVSNIKYDLNGNIQTLKRKQNNTLIDDLNYDYDGNKLVSLDDIIDHEEGFRDGAELDLEYVYDANGNMISDANKLISSMTYNLLNKPETITFSNGDHIDYTYDAAGTRLSMAVTTGGQTYTTDYSSGLIFEDNELKLVAMPHGRIVVEQVAADYNFDYQYHLTDHLGNVRATVAPVTRVYQATMESETASVEESLFLNLAPSRHLDAVNAKTGDESARLNANRDQIIGPAKAIKVFAGDVVDLKVHAKYLSTAGATQATTNLMIFDALASAYSLGGGGELYNAFQNLFSGTALTAQSADEVPAAYLNYVLYDLNYENPQLGYAQVSASARNAFEELSINITIPEEGYLFTYLSNESSLDADVYFDDYMVTHTSAAYVLQADDYYPFGLPITGTQYEDQGNATNRFLYQGKEWQTALALNLYDFHARQYDPATGRFLSNDPKNQFASGYTGMGNQPTVMVDPDGEIAWFVPLIIGAVINTAANHDRIDNVWDGLGYAAVGAASAYVGGAVSGANIAFSNTLALASASTLSSVGNHGVSGGEGDIYTSFGGVSVNWSQGDVGYLGEKGNSGLENFGYALGALANVSDVLAGFKPTDVQLNTEDSNAIGHSALTKVGETDPYNSLVSVGPDPSGLPMKEFLSPQKFHRGTNKWNNYVDASSDITKITVKGVNIKRIASYGAKLDRGVKYNTYFSSCVNHCARALTISGVPSIGIHPFILNSQIYLRSIGVRPTLFSYQFYNK